MPRNIMVHARTDRQFTEWWRHLAARYPRLADALDCYVYVSVSPTALASLRALPGAYERKLCAFAVCRRPMGAVLRRCWRFAPRFDAAL